jgi:hypothetical protein
MVGLTWVFVLGLSATRSSGGEKPGVILNRGTPLRTWMVYRTPVVIGTDGYVNRRSRAFMKPDWPIDRQDLDRRLFEMAAKVAAVAGPGAVK